MRYRFGDWVIETQINRLGRGDESVRLEPKTMDLLEYLLRHPGETVSRDQILDSVWAGRVVEPEAVARGINQIRQALDDDPRKPHYIETIHKRGYRTLAAVERLPASDPTDAPPVIETHKSVPEIVVNKLRWGPRRSAVLGLFLALALALALSAVILMVGPSPDSPAGQSSIAILPFRDLSVEGGFQNFSDGLTAELIHLLSSVDGLRVISATSSFSLRDDARPLRDIARTLDVEHILEGSVRRTRDGVRITAQLVETGTDVSVWSASYDADLRSDAIIDAQLEVAGRVSESLKLEFDRPGGGSAPVSVAALDRYYEGMYYLRRIQTSHLQTEALGVQAIRLFESAIEADPGWAPAHAALGQTYHFMANRTDTANRLRRSMQHVQDALDLDPEYGPAYESLGYLLAYDGDYDGAMEAFDTASNLGYEAHWGRAIVLMVLSRFEEAIVHYQNKVTLDPLSIPVRWQLTQANFCAGRYDPVIATSRTLIEADPGDLHSRIRMAIALVRSGREEEAGLVIRPVLETPELMPALALYFAASGQTELSMRAIESSTDVHPRLVAESAAPAAVILGRPDLAVQLLEKASSRIDLRTSEGFDYLFHFRCAEETRSLAGDVRYDAMLASLGLN